MAISQVLGSIKHSRTWYHSIFLSSTPVLLSLIRSTATYFSRSDKYQHFNGVSGRKNQSTMAQSNEKPPSTMKRSRQGATEVCAFPMP